MLRTAIQNKQLHAILGKLNLEQEVKQQLVFNHTQGRTTSTKEMQINECQALINYLNHLQKNIVEVKEVPAPVKLITPEQKMRRKVLSICHEMGWRLPSGKIDINRVNAFCLNHSTLKKELNAHTAKELPKLISQFEQLLKKQYAAR